jgi:hypothetical protein
MVCARMDVVTAFWIALLVTVVLMFVSLALGLRGARRLHLWTGPLTIVCLGVAVWFAIALGRIYVFPPVPMAVHRVFATLAGIMAVAVAITGCLLVRREGARRWHRGCVMAFVASALCATATGVWIWSAAVPR